MAHADKFYLDMAYEQDKHKLTEYVVTNILTELDEVIELSENGGTNRDFIDGLKRARSVIAPKPESLDYPRLF